MRLLDRLLGKSEELTPLQALIAQINSEAARRAFEAAKEDSLRVPSAVSVVVLLTAGKFCRSVMELSQAVPLRAERWSGRDYDILAFESAAFALYYLMRDQLAENSEYDHDEQEENDLHFDALTTTAHITEKILYSHKNLGLPEQFFVNRVGSYSRPERRDLREEASEFAMVALLSLQNGSPTRSSRSSPPESLAKTLAVNSAAGIFHQTSLPALKEVTRRIYQYELDNPA